MSVVVPFEQVKCTYCHGGADEQREDKGNDVVLLCPEVDIDGVEHDEEGEAPADAVNHHALSGGGELVNDGAE